MTKKRRQNRRLMPSIESQLMAFIELCEVNQTRRRTQLKWDGFKVYVRYTPRGYLPAPDDQLHVIVIAAVGVPKRYRERQWFWRFCQLCLALSRDGVAIESVHNPELQEALRRHPEFEEYQERNFFIRKRHPGDRPLKLTHLEFPYGDGYAGRPIKL